MQARSVTRVVHVITGLMVGGAEVMLARLVEALDPSIDNRVICLSPGGPIADKIRALGVPVLELGLPAGGRALLGLPTLVRELRAAEPDVVHTWMYHADFLGGIAAKALGIPVVWALHNSTLDPVQTRRSTRWIVHLLARLSGTVPVRIVSCSEVGTRVHEAIGYEPSRMIVIPNGFDTEQFKPNPQFRAEARRAWNCQADDLVIGHVARFHAQKDHGTFLKAAGLALAAEPRLRFVLYGSNVTPDNAALIAWARAAGILDRCSFLGQEAAVQRKLPGFDLLVSSSSFGEAFPLVLGEAMASGVLCVTTDVGDSAAIVGDLRRTVPPSDPAALANAILNAAHLTDSARRIAIDTGIERIQQNFALSKIAERYRALYVETATMQ